MRFPGIRIFSCLAAGVSLLSCKPVPKNELSRREPDSRAVFDALGIRRWQVDLSIPRDHPSGLAVYLKAEGKAAKPINGIGIFNTKGSRLVEKTTVTVVFQALLDGKGGRRFIVGMNALGASGWTYEIADPFAPGAAYGWFGGDLKMDEKGRVLLVFSEGNQTIIPGKPIEEYTSAIYLQLAPWTSARP